MALMTMLTCQAVPFHYPEGRGRGESNQQSIAARRSRSRRLRQHFDTNPVAKEHQQRHLMLTTMMVDEALDTFKDVTRTNSEACQGTVIAPTRAPPNSPNDKFTFNFPDPLTLNSDLIEQAEEEEGENEEHHEPRETNVTSMCQPRGSRGRRSLRKRRRVPSFKIPRVPCKISPSSSSEEADDEASDEDIIIDTKAAVMNNHHIVKNPSTTSSNDDSNSDEFDQEELKLKLKVLSEVRNLDNRRLESAKSRLNKTDWGKVGSELRQIADKFSAAESSSPDELDSSLRSSATEPVDLLSLLNLMLPFSVPRSLWSALVSYAAWKIFKRFQ